MGDEGRESERKETQREEHEERMRVDQERATRDGGRNGRVVWETGGGTVCEREKLGCKGGGGGEDARIAKANVRYGVVIATPQLITSFFGPGNIYPFHTLPLEAPVLTPSLWGSSVSCLRSPRL